MEERRKAMQEWWKKHFELMISSKLHKRDIEKVFQSERIKLREKLPEMLGLLHLKKIPFIIISSAALGIESISLILKRDKSIYSNIFIISNEFIWNKNGTAIGIKEPIIHCMNKKEASLKHLPAYKEIKDRKNVILIGDSIDDIKMAEGVSYKNIIKICFLNEPENLEEYKKVYDIILLGDPDMSYVFNLVKEILGEK